MIKKKTLGISVYFVPERVFVLYYHILDKHSIKIFSSIFNQNIYLIFH